MADQALRYVEKLNKDYFKIHHAYERLFWLFAMGDHSVAAEKDAALKRLESFRTDPAPLTKLRSLEKDADKKTAQKIGSWITFFERYQAPPEAIAIKEKIDKLESLVSKRQAERKEGYKDPKTGKFVAASALKMGGMMRIHDDEAVRKACFDAREEFAKENLKEYVELVALRNSFARVMGFEDFYEFKIRREEGMSKKELFDLFDAIYEKTKYAFKDIRKMEQKMPGLRKPWNFSYMLAGSFTKEEDPYFPFDQALTRWGRSFASLGIDFKGGELTLDLLDRKGKYNNGFCHWPKPVRYEGDRRLPGAADFTCNVVVGQVGSSAQGYHTLFHEGGHAAHYLNITEREIILNTEYPPASTAWAETQSMFLDTVFSSMEWKSRYAKDLAGNTYPFDLFERKVRKFHPLSPLDLNGIIFVSAFEKEIYETKNLTEEKVVKIARKAAKKYFDRSADTLSVLNTPHIYHWDNTASYHGYGLAELALAQWWEYFYKKYGYIVDNPKVGKEMEQVWKRGAARTFKEFVILATGEDLSPKAFLKSVTRSIPAKLKIAKERIARLEKLKEKKGPINLNATVRMTSGKKEIANSRKGFERMAATYGAWIKKQTGGK